MNSITNWTWIKNVYVQFVTYKLIPEVKTKSHKEKLRQSGR